MIRRLLVAHRGEIARRVFATCRLVGIETVAVYSDADADAPHVTEADYAVHLPGNSPSSTYLRGDLIIAAARRAGANAVHPGNGVMAEDPSGNRVIPFARLPLTHFARVLLLEPHADEDEPRHEHHRHDAEGRA